MRVPVFLRAGVRPSWRLLLAAVSCGAVMGLGQVPVGIWAATLAGLAVLLWLTGRQPCAPSAGWIGFAAGFGHTLVTMYWITEPFFVEPEVYGWMAPFALLLMGAGFGLFWGLACGIGHRLGVGPWRVVVIALALICSDVLRSYAFTGFPWVLFGHIWIDTPIAQAAAVMGQLGLGLITVLCAAALACIRWRAGQACAVGMAVVMVGLWTDPGDWLRSPVLQRQVPINLRLIQPNAAQRLKWLPQYRTMFFRRHLDLTAAPVAPGDPVPDLIIWPETAVPFLLEWPGDGLDMIAQAAKGTPLAFGVQRAVGTRYYNSLAVMDAQGRIGPTYDKVHLVPFGEYIPFGDVLARFGVSAFAAQQGHGYTPGAAEAVLDLGRAGHVQPLICYEAVFPQDIRRAPSRPDWIMQVTNDAWFGTLSGPRQHFSLTRMRAIEFGLPIARVANTGITAMIDASGTVIAQLGLGEIGHLDVTVPPSRAPTPYTRMGDGPIIALILLLFAGFSFLGRYFVDPVESDS
ncbi:apolipoprotein N-acyltransferase [Thioclava sp. SK-1]|uniref:apolipoprotein N-acyltransferase n=1 Tax=Thioclava sp. SK-1 TaxID=1889770 RepID=UPI000824173A|nr:apolipoprotein N-acyltransferase [Thioclava sp. SK-1]OCX66520.1 apolipoprotein N-acyltransferase [Thioclava sp. SK-1]